MLDFDHLLNQYRTLWNNRALIVEENSETTLIEAIKRELLDENSHPRVRKNVHEKFYLAIKRISTSTLSKEDKLTIISLYIQVLEQITSK